MPPATRPAPGVGEATDGAPARQAGGARWQFASRLVTQLANLGIFLVAARILTPADFGLFALVQAISMFLFLIAAGGWREFIMSYSGAKSAIDQAITLALVSGVLMGFLGLAGSAVLALGFSYVTSGCLLAVFSLCVMASPVANAFAGVLVRAGKLKQLSLAQIAGETTGLAVGIGGLLAGWNVYALALGKVAMLLVSLTGAMVFSRWALVLTLRAGHGRALFDFSKQILGNRTVAAIGGNASTLIVGSFLGVSSVGYFRAAERVVSAVSEIVYEPLRIISWSRFRLAADDETAGATTEDRLKAEADKVFPLYLALAAPPFAGLAVTAGDAVALLLGAQWRPAAPIIAILTISALCYVPTTTTEPILSVAGQIRRILPVIIVNTGATVVLLLLFARFGLIPTALAQAGGSLVLFSTVTWLQHKYVGVSWLGAIRRSWPVAIATGVLVLVTLVAHEALLSAGVSSVLRVVLEIGAGAAAYILVLAMLWPGFLRLAREL